MSDQGEDVITTAHGAGSGKMRELLGDLVLPRFADGEERATVGLDALDDGAVLPLPESGAMVVTTDSHVVDPPVFPGGDIGRLAVAGTVNDLAVMGATEDLWLTSSLVVEEGTPLSLVEQVLDSMQTACEEAGCRIVTGDTKVMGSGEIDTLAINTTGVARVRSDEFVTDAGMQVGDRVICTGTVGDHGISLLSEREGFDFEGELSSDVTPINGLVATAMAAGPVTAMKDPTRGGFSAAIVEMAEKADVGVELDESTLPVTPSVASAGEILGIEPVDVANEGKAILSVRPGAAEVVLDAIQDHADGRDAAIVGTVTEDHPGRVVLDTGFGRRYMTAPEGTPLPRIC